MSYFPFLWILRKKILIVGAGKIAFDKAEKMLMYHADLVVIAPEKDPSFDLLSDQIHFIEKPYEQTDLNDDFCRYCSDKFCSNQ